MPNARRHKRTRATSPSAPPMNEAEIAAGLPSTPNYQYAQRVGSQLFLAGQVPQAADGSIVAPGDPCAQASQCLANLNKVLAVQGFAAPDIRRVVVYVVGEQADLSAAWGRRDRAFWRASASGNAPGCRPPGIPGAGGGDRRHRRQGLGACAASLKCRVTRH